jgi:hypothetical protein
VRQDAGEALFWFMVAARHGDTAAAERARFLQTQLTGMQVAQARARMEAFRPRALNALANGEFAPAAAAEAQAPAADAAASEAEQPAVAAPPASPVFPSAQQ